MIKNLRSPQVLSAEIVEQHSNSVAATIAICQLFAEGWSLYENGGWSNEGISTFLLTIHKNGIGPDPTGTILRQNIDGRYKIKSNAGSFSFMKSVGEHQLFRNDTLKQTCRVTGYSVLYAITLFYDAVEASYKDPKVGTKRATNQTLKLLARGSELTREDVYAARDQIVVSQSRAPKTPASKQTSQKSTTYEHLVTTGEQYGNVFLTPPPEVMDDIENSGFESLQENYSYLDIRTLEADLSILVEGSSLNAAIKLANTMNCPKPNVYCVTKTNRNERIINLNEEQVLVTSKQVAPPKNITKGQEISKVVQATIHNPKDANLHLFADGEVDGWVSCIGVDASRT